MKQFAIIGAGQLGSRHMQSLAGYEGKASLFVYDPSAASLEIAQQRWQEAGNPASIQITFTSNLQTLPESLDLAIVATGASVRRPVTEALLSQCQVRYLILEKVLFQRMEDYDAIGRLLNERGVQTWVNCPRRMYTFYQQLREELAGAQPMQFSIQGNKWGMGCNAIHFLDLFAYLTGGNALNEAVSMLEPRILPSKRAGYAEFAGQIITLDARGNSFIASCREDELPIQMSISIHNADLSYYLVEQDKKAFVVRNGRSEILSMEIPFQSQLTLRLANTLLTKGHCELTSYEESARLHKALLPTYLKHYNVITGNPSNDTCPIT